MDGTDSENISEEELIDFLKSVANGSKICPVCKKNKLNLDVFDLHEFDFETYIRGIKYPFIYAEISCKCGFHNRFNTNWCLKGTDGTEKKIYRVGLAVGGVMEKQEFTYENIQDIEAYSERDAIKRYIELNGNNYWSPIVIED